MQPSPAAPTSYRKLPGRLRGLGYGASAWLGLDHILVVHSAMFREGYKRYYLRDIQAVVMARRPRYVITLPVLIVGLLWLFFGMIPIVAAGRALIVYLGVTLAMAALWLYIAVSRSCSCRIVTAVSNDDLSSICRLRSARKFLEELQPLIDEVQGRWEAPPIPAPEAPPIDTPAPEPAASAPAPAPVSTAIAAPPPATQHPGIACPIFVVILMAGAAATLLTLHTLTAGIRWLMNAFALVEMVAAVAVIVDRARGRAPAGLQKLAIVKLAAIGLLYYCSVYFGAISSGGQPALADASSMFLLPAFAPLRAFNAGLSFVMGVIGLVILLRSHPRRPDIMN